MAAIVVVLVVLVSSAYAARSRGPTETFTDRIARYMTLRSEATAAVGRLYVRETPRQVTADQVELTRQLQALRRDAREGDIFGGSVADAVRSSLRERFAHDDPDVAANIMFDVQPEPFALVIARMPTCCRSSSTRSRRHPRRPLHPRRRRCADVAGAPSPHAE
jgi:hypothetical protein